ncbi:hypothetical protein FJZ36_01385 [Candidatus Poribacteria bacterium]|nr:hypothetical protein [Candidatus Poribacteria bacterium]
MTSYERIMRQAHFQPVDRIPLLAGWINGAVHLQELGGTTEDEFWKDPWTGALKAYRNLGADGMLGHIVPRGQDTIRQSYILERDQTNHSVDEVLAFAESRPTDDEILARFDADAYAKELRTHLETTQARYGDVQYLPARWDCSATFGWYGTFGYTAYYEAVALHPEAFDRIYRASAVAARARNEVIARVYSALKRPPLIMTGDDICDNNGPMVSPRFLRKHYFPWLKYSLEPLHQGGIKTICHCDGNVMPIMDDILACGFCGLQGFQEELGVHISDLVKLRTATGDRLLLFAGMSVTRTLPWGSVQDVEEDVAYAIDVTEGGKGLFLFSANVINPEVPTDNIRAAYRHAAQYSTGFSTPVQERRTEWPFGVKTGELIGARVF